MRDKEVRAAKRYPISAWGHAQWKDDGKVRHECIAVTRDVSSRGVFLYTQDIPPVGAVIDVMLELSTIATPAIGKLQLRGVGRVVRATPDIGFAAEVAFRLLG